jgi:hypothetical protein
VGVVLGAGYVELFIAAFVGLWVYRQCTAAMPESGGYSTGGRSGATNSAV